MKTKEIEESWEKDCVFNDMKIQEEIRKTLSLHSKYHNMLNDERTALRKLERELPELKLDLKDYYEGNISLEVLEKRKWKPFQRALLKTNVPLYIEADKAMRELQDQITLQSYKVKFLEDIVKQINSRNFLIKSSIEINKLMFGVV